MKTFHVSQSITGPLMNWNKSDWKKATKWLKRPDGGTFTAWELKQAFIEELAQGHECIPIGNCDNFDFKQGCLGHEKDESLKST